MDHNRILGFVPHTEFVEDEVHRTRAEPRLSNGEYIEVFRNRQRRRSAAVYLTR